MNFRLKWSGRRAWRYGGATLVVALSGVCSDIFFRLTGTHRLSSIFLAGVLVAAFLFGTGPGYLASALAFVTYMWIVDPRYTFAFGSAEDFDTLMVFLAVSMLIGMLIGRIRDEAAASRARAEATEALLSSTREFADETEEQVVRARLLQTVAAAARGQAFLRHEQDLGIWPERAPSHELSLMTASYERRARGAVETAPAGDWMVRPLRSGDSYYGVVGWRTSGTLLTPEEAALIDVLVDTGAAAIARIRLIQAKSEAETHARTQDLRNALLSSISHDVRTPLAAILASATSLQEFGENFDATTRKDLAATIQEETVRLDAFVANLLNMSRLEAGALQIAPCAFNVPEVVSRMVEQRRRRAPGADVSVRIAPFLPEALGDESLFEQALGNVFDNALRYADGAAVTVVAHQDQGQIKVEVCDEGPGVPEDDVERIFEKFYRAPGQPQAHGTGLGLPIARGLIQAMGGGMMARNIGQREGLSVIISLPVAA